eukprot:9100062-Alexandrium_andersonii.AAC.1
MQQHNPSRNAWWVPADRCAPSGISCRPHTLRIRHAPSWHATRCARIPICHQLEQETSHAP